MITVPKEHILYLFGLMNYLLGYAVQSSFVYVPLLAESFGAGYYQVGLIGAAYGGAVWLSSLFSGWKSDTVGRQRFMRWGLLLGSAAFASQILSNSVFTLALARGAVGFALGISLAATIAYAYESGMDMGKFSSYGALGWISGALTAAVLTHYRLGDIQTLFLLSTVICFMAFLVSRLFQDTAPKQIIKPPNIWHILRRGYRIYLAVAFRQIGATAVWAILPLHMVALGFDEKWVAISWAVTFGTQFVVMRFLERFSEHKLFALGQICSFLVLFFFAFASSLVSILAIQGLLGLAWSFLYVGGLLIIMKSGEERGTASGIFQSTLNLCGAIGPLLGGLIAQFVGVRGVMLFAAAMCIVGFFIAIPKLDKTVGNK